MVIGQFVREGREKLVDKYGHFTAEGQYGGSFMLLDGLQDVVGAGLGAHELGFVEDTLAHGLAIGVEGGGADIGGREVGGDPEHLDARVQQFRPDGFQPAAKGEFRGGIGAPARQSPVACDGGYPYDRSLPFQDGGQGELGAIDGAQEVGLHDLAGHFRRAVHEEGPHADTGIIDEDIDAAEGVDRRFDKAAAVLFIAYVTGYGMEEDIGVFHLQLVDLIMVAAAGRHFGAQGDERFDQRFADAVTAARDHYHFILEKRHVISELDCLQK